MDNPRSSSARVRLEAAADLPTRFGEFRVRVFSIRQLAAHGIPAERIPHSIEPGPHNRAYLETKARRSGHLL